METPIWILCPEVAAGGKRARRLRRGTARIQHALTCIACITAPAATAPMHRLKEVPWPRRACTCTSDANGDLAAAKCHKLQPGHCLNALRLRKYRSPQAGTSA